MGRRRSPGTTVNLSERLVTVTTINGVRVQEARARISVFDNALLYAEGLFETFLAIGQDVVFLEEHLERLYTGAGVIDLRLPVDRATLSSWMLKTVKAHPAEVKKLRLTVTSGESARWVGVQGEPQVILSASPHEMPTEPFRLAVSELRVDQTSIFRRIKTISYAIHAASLKRAKACGYDDALLLNTNGDVAEVTTANIFWVKRSKVYTPPLTAGCLDGVTRKVILANRKELGINLVEKSERLNDMLEADEIFISSSLKLVVGVSEIADDTTNHRFAPGEITHRVREYFEDRVFRS